MGKRRCKLARMCERRALLEARDMWEYETYLGLAIRTGKFQRGSSPSSDTSSRTYTTRTRRRLHPVLIDAAFPVKGEGDDRVVIVVMQTEWQSGLKLSDRMAHVSCPIEWRMSIVRSSAWVCNLIKQLWKWS